MLKKEIIINDLKINYLISDNFNPQKAVVFLPGWKSPAEIFCNSVQLDNLLAVDFPGFAESEQPKETWGIQEYADFLKNLLAKLGIENPLIIGHSFGAGIAVKYASLKYPLRKMILIGPAIIRRKSLKTRLYWLGAKLFRLFLPFKLAKLRAKFYNKINSPDYMQAGSMLDIYKKIISEDLSADLPKILNIPITIINGDKDKDTPFVIAQKIQAQLPAANLFIIKNAGHYCFIDQSAEFNQILSKELI